MAYEKQTWSTGDTVTAAKLNHIEDGISEAGSLPPVTPADNGKVLAVEDGAWAADSNLFLVTVTGSASDKSRSEILNAIEEGRSVVLIKGTSRYFPSGQDNSFVYFINETKIANDRYINVISVSENKSASVDKIYMLPNPSSSDNGKELVIKNSSVVYQAKKFTVTLTPTSPDFSGTMDKTPAEITAAYGAGQEIVFDIPSMSARIHATQFLEVNEVIRAGGMVFYDVNSSPVIITLLTSGEDSTYLTQIFAMTPAS